MFCAPESPRAFQRPSETQQSTNKKSSSHLVPPPFRLISSLPIPSHLIPSPFPLEKIKSATRCIYVNKLAKYAAPDPRQLQRRAAVERSRTLKKQSRSAVYLPILCTVSLPPLCVVGSIVDSPSSVCQGIEKTRASTSNQSNPAIPCTASETSPLSVACPPQPPIYACWPIVPTSFVLDPSERHFMPDTVRTGRPAKPQR